MEEYVILAALLKLGYALAAVIGMVLMLRWLDRRLGLQFSEILGKMREEPSALALYFGARIIAVAIVIGSVIG